MTKGTITRLIAGRGYGFIQTENNEVVFFPHNELVGRTYGSLREDQQVEFDVMHTLKGLKAVNVRVAGQKWHPANK